MVKCCDCGMLEVRSFDDNEIHEATSNYRERGRQGNRGGEPICHLDVRRFDKGDGPWLPRTILSEIGVEIECEQFIKYSPGKTPQQVEEMSWQQTALEAKERSADALSRIADVQSRVADLHDTYLSWRKDQADKDERFAKQLQALEETRHQETRVDQKSVASRQNMISWLALAAAILAVIVAASSPFIERGSSFKDPQIQSPTPIAIPSESNALPRN